MFPVDFVLFEGGGDLIGKLCDLYLAAVNFVVNLDERVL
jgi:hypothetical protein